MQFLMAQSSTSLPIQESLVNDTQALAEELNISFSSLVTLALKDFIRRYRGRQNLIAEINAAQTDAPNEDEARLQQRIRSSHRQLVEGEW